MLCSESSPDHGNMHFVSCLDNGGSGRRPSKAFPAIEDGLYGTLRRALMCKDGVGEFRYRIERFFRRFTMRRMPGAFNDRHIDRTVTLLLGDLDLPYCPILVVGALDDRNRHADVGKIIRDIPGAEFRIEPGAVPAVEGVVDILVPARE